MSEIVRDYAREIAEIDWYVAKYDQNYLVAEISKAVEKRDCRTRELFEFVREYEKSILKNENRILRDEKKKHWDQRKESLRPFARGVVGLITTAVFPTALYISFRISFKGGSLLFFPLMVVLTLVLLGTGIWLLSWLDNSKQ